MARRYGGEQREFTPDHRQAFEDINKVVNQLGFSSDDYSSARQELSKYMPKEVFLNKYGNEDGWSMLYALYAPQIVHDFFKTEKRPGEKRQSPTSRRLQYQEVAGDAMDYVQSVFMGYHDDQDQFTGGVRSVALPSDEDAGFNNKYVYDPAQRRSRPTVCPHCKVSFWTMSAGNGDPQYEIVDGSAVAEWRGDPLEAPEHVRFNPKTGEKQESGGYSYCGGRHEVFDVSLPEGGVDIELAEKIAGMSWDDLRTQNRIRSVPGEGSVKFFLVDELLDDVEKKLGGDVAYKKFSGDWLYEDGGKLYRQCRHPITLKSPASVIYDRIAKYTYNLSEKRTQGRAHRIKVYMCPECPGEFKDIDDITTGKEGKSKVSVVQCDDCNAWFDITDLPEDHKYSMQWVDKQRSLNVSIGDEGRVSELIDTVESHDIGQLEIELVEIFDIFDEEIQKISRDLNVRGAEYAKDVFEDWVVSGLDLKELTEKYFIGTYKLHYTECLDCGARTGVDTDDEKSNPDATSKSSYDQGYPVVMTQCPRRNSDTRHQVELAQTQIQAPEEQQVEQPHTTSVAPAWGGPQKDPTQLAKTDLHEQGEERGELATEPAKVDQVDQTVRDLDDEQRRRYLGLNLIYHGRAPKGTDVPGISYLINPETESSEALPASDSRSYKGDDGIITRHIYAPAQRLIKSIIEALENNSRIRDKHSETLDMFNDLAEKSLLVARKIARVRSFCKTG